MVLNIKISPGLGLRIIHSGFFDLNKIYNDVRNWYEDNDYNYLEKEQTKKAGKRGEEISFKFEGERTINYLVKYKIFIKIKCTSLIKEKSFYNGNIDILLTVNLEIDYKNNWSRSALSNLLFKVYTKYIIKDKIKFWSRSLFSEMTELQDIIKSNLKQHL